jgi:hypothetical protein
MLSLVFVLLNSPAVLVVPPDSGGAESTTEPVKVSVKATWFFEDVLGEYEEGTWDVTLYPSGSVKGQVNGSAFSAKRVSSKVQEQIDRLVRCVFATPKPNLPVPAIMDPSPPRVTLEVAAGSKQRRVPLDTQGQELAVENAWPTLALVSEMCGLVSGSAGRECREWLDPYLHRLSESDTTCGIEVSAR